MYIVRSEAMTSSNVITGYVREAQCASRLANLRLLSARSPEHEVRISIVRDTFHVLRPRVLLREYQNIPQAL